MNSDPSQGETELDRTTVKEAVPQNIGPYKVLEVLGEGGMGVVYLAEQQEPIRRRVAVKLIKLGMDTKQVIARFESERQALALMNHPNVAKVLDAGSTEQGRPYFVMEHVPGIPITDYCDRHRLNITERLDLFTQACHAIQHAHQKGIIHRDVKSSNVLVAVQDGKPVPKVIDFGVAKATERRLTERTLFTEQGQLIGTPEYMSPEQAEMTALDIDTRTDIYSLGVLLYQLLAGALPFEPASLRGAAFGEIQRIIREQDPPKPSTRLSSLGDESGAVAEKHRTNAGSLERQLRGDLDWITMKAMEKDRTRRYATAAELADDIARHVNHEPVLAGPPGAGYRLSKFVRRHRHAVAAVLTLIVVLSIGLVTSISLYVRAERARAESDRARAEAEAVTTFLSDTLASVDPAEARGREVTVKEMLDEAAGKIDTAFVDQPLVEATLRTTIGKTYRALGKYSNAEVHLRTAVKVRKRELGNEHSDVAAALTDLGAVLEAEGEYESAEQLLREALAIRRKLHGDKHPDVAQSLNNLGVLLYRRRDYDGAEVLWRDVLAIRRKRLGDDHPRVAEILNNLGLLLWRRRDYDGAAPLLREALAIRRRHLGDDHPKVAGAFNNLGNLLRDKGDYNGAELLFCEVLAIRRKLHGDDDHPGTADALNNLAAVLLDKGDYAGAEVFSREALAIRRRLHGDEHRNVAQALNNLAEALAGMGDYAAAEPLICEAIAMQRKTVGKDHPHLGYFLDTLGEVLVAKGDAEAAEPVLRESLAILRNALPDDHSMIARTESLLGNCLTTLGRYQEAEPLLVSRYPDLVRAHGNSDKYVVEGLHRIIALYEAWGKPEKTAEYRAMLPASGPSTHED